MGKRKLKKKGLEELKIVFGLMLRSYSSERLKVMKPAILPLSLGFMLGMH